MKYTEILRQLRHEKGYSQAELARILNTTQQQINKYESEKQELPLRRFIELIELYEVSADYVLGRSSQRDVQA